MREAYNQLLEHFDLIAGLDKVGGEGFAADVVVQVGRET